MPGTFFALACLVLLGDNLERVRRKECLGFIKRMQRSDGSFGETEGEEGRIEGGRDARFGYCAAGVRWMLGGDCGEGDIDVDGFVECTRECQVGCFGFG